jgi:hypothetical protein
VVQTVFGNGNVSHLSELQFASFPLECAMKKRPTLNVERSIFAMVGRRCRAAAD